MIAVQHRAKKRIMSNVGVFTDDDYLVAALRRGDEVAFEWLIEQYHTSMVRLARLYTSSHEVAEEAVQETWMGFLKGLDRYEARCSVKTWLFTILTNCAKTRGQREGRSVCFSSLAGSETQSGEAAVPDELFRADEPWHDHWVSGPSNWKETPEDCMLAEETRAFIEGAIEALPVTQRAVITLHDIDGWRPEEICNILGIMETNQRVLLHRARSRVRLALEQYLGED
jgi:RNA polymerase sigma-70 factor (ECF subfamily)